MWAFLAKLAAKALVYAADHPAQAIELAKVAAKKLDPKDADAA